MRESTRKRKHKILLKRDETHRGIHKHVRFPRLTPLAESQRYNSDCFIDSSCVCSYFMNQIEKDIKSQGQILRDMKSIF